MRSLPRTILHTNCHGWHLLQTPPAVTFATAGKLPKSRDAEGMAKVLALKDQGDEACQVEAISAFTGVFGLEFLSTSKGYCICSREVSELQMCQQCSIDITTGLEIFCLAKPFGTKDPIPTEEVFIPTATRPQALPDLFTWMQSQSKGNRASRSRNHIKMHKRKCQPTPTDFIPQFQVLKFSTVKFI